MNQIICNTERLDVMQSVIIKEIEMIIPTYEACEPEPLPMFAENRCHQRTSGRPYPNTVTLEVQREKKTDKEYKAVVLENEYLEVVILPEIGGRIYSAKDKRTGYDFFYKQHVIKPALIGALGNWVSGGLEFNWPFHHRASTFMPVDYVLEQAEDGSATIWMSEHDPVERMKGMVGVTLRPGRAVLETHMKLCNRTPFTRSFLWWENAAVPVNPDYRIFFPPDVTYVNFHYKRSVSSFPIADGVFNGIDMGHHPDISKHGNTLQPTSYFSAPSKYDFFGGYDERIGCGVIHVADHHISIGKKMFTWAYNQLSQSWERALTDTDGAYAELMAGSYSDNQPDFAWLEPYEEKSFCQMWYPVSDLGVPQFANGKAALRIEGEQVLIYTTEDLENALLTVSANGKELIRQRADFTAGKIQAFSVKHTGFVTVTLSDQNSNTVFTFTEFEPDRTFLPETTKDILYHKETKSADELYLAGVHVEQYRDPAVYPDAYWKEALMRDPAHIPSLTAMGEYLLKQTDYEGAAGYFESAITYLTRFNNHPKSTEVYYLYGLALQNLGETEKAYDMFYKAAWVGSVASRAMIQIAAIDGQRSDYIKMKEHAEWALGSGSGNPVAPVYLALAHWKLGNYDKAGTVLAEQLKNDPLNHLARYSACLVANDDSGFYEKLNSDPSSTCLDLYFDLATAGFLPEATKLLLGLTQKQTGLLPIIYYILGLNLKQKQYVEIADACQLGTTYPFRAEEKHLLEQVLAQYPMNARVRYLLGCICYHNRQYSEAEAYFQSAIGFCESDYASYRNLAALYYSHLDKKAQVIPLLIKALSYSPENKQLIFELSHVMTKLGASGEEHVSFLLGHESALLRDDIALELAKSYNRGGNYEAALKTLLSHHFIPCEGGEHAVADQYMFAYHGAARLALQAEQYEKASDLFAKASQLPNSLGAGLWHEAKTVPHQFYRAVCLRKLGQVTEADEIFEYICGLTVDYFSNMHLPELPVYKAISLRLLGYTAEADRMIGEFYLNCMAQIEKEDIGFFKTTPFFLCYIDDPKTARRAYYSYLIGLTHLYQGDFEQAQYFIVQSVTLDPDSVYPYLFLQDLSSGKSDKPTVLSKFEQTWTVYA